MSLTPEQLQAKRDALTSQIATGVQSVRYSDGKQVQYFTVQEAIAAIAVIDREMGKAGSIGRQTHFQPACDRGT